MLRLHCSKPISLQKTDIEWNVQSTKLIDFLSMTSGAPTTGHAVDVDCGVDYPLP